MLKNTLILFFLFILFSNYGYANNFIEKKVNGFKFKFIKYDLQSKDYIFKVGANPDYSATGLRDLMEANNGISAINGVFFCPESYKECGGQNFTFNERYVEGQKIGSTREKDVNIVFAIDKENKPFLYKKDFINPENENNIFYGLGNFPLLLKDGKNVVEDFAKAGLIDKKMKAKMIRNFICSDKTNRYIYTGYTDAIELEKLPDVLLKLGCNNALNLDAGGSSAMIYNSRYVVGPGRNILDGVIIERKDLNTKLIIENSKEIGDKIKNKLISKPYEEKIELLDKISIAIDKSRKTIYENNSFDIFDIDSGKKIGYEIDIKDVNLLAKVYFINYFNKVTYELKQSYINEKIEAEKKEKDNINKSNLLF